MPTNPGIPVAAYEAGPLNPYDWVGVNEDDLAGAMQSSLMRGQPAFAEPWQMRQIRGPETIPQGAPVYLHSRPYSRGAQAFSPKFGLIPINPIGAGVPAPYRLPTIAGPGARYVYGAIWFDVQTIPTSLRASRTIPMEAVDALIATSHVGGMYPTTG